jgi:hypothetical protein
MGIVLVYPAHTLPIAILTRKQTSVGFFSFILRRKWPHRSEYQLWFAREKQSNNPIDIAEELIVQIIIAEDIPARTNLARTHYYTVWILGHFKVPLYVNEVPLITFRGSLKSAQDTCVPKCIRGSLIEVPQRALGALWKLPQKRFRGTLWSALKWL